MVFSAALSGIKASSEELSVIGNNVANAATIGFKSSRAVFSDIYANSSLGESSANSAGSGVRLSDVQQSFEQGNINFTNNNLDLAISGQGFFMVSDNGTPVFSRAGSFGIDKDGFLSNNQGQQLIGLQADVQGNITGVRDELKVDSANIPPVPSSAIDVGVNLSANATPPPVGWTGGANPSPDTFNNVTSVTIYDSLGNSHILSSYFIKTGTANQWDVRVQVDGVEVDSAPAAAPFTQVFNANGSYNAAGSEAISVAYTPPGGATAQNIAVNLVGATQYGSDFAVQSISQNGFATGRLDSIDVDAKGVIFGRYTNGQSRAMGQIQLANFSSADGLQPLGGSAWGETLSSGAPLIGSPGTASLGVLQSGALEDSNVDLTAELIKLITAQRNYQANAQTIRTGDAVTQTIINIR